MLLNTAEFTSLSTPELFPLTPGEPNEQMVGVRYAPKARGEYETEITFLATFADGTVEQQHVPVTARAHEITDPAYPDADRDVIESSKQEAGHIAASATNTRFANQPGTQGSENVKVAVNNAVTALFDAQKAGVAEIRREQGTYAPPPPPKPIWQELVGIAVEVGLVMVAGELGALAAGAIESRLSEELGKAIGKRVEKVIETTIEKIGEAAKKGELSGESVPPAEKSGHEEGLPLSFDPMSDFFLRQESRIEAAKGEAQLDVNEQISNLIGEFGADSSRVSEAVAAIRAVGSIDRVQARQSQITTAQWMKYLARTKLPIVTAPMGNGSLTTTVMAEPREELPTQAGGPWGGRFPGVLEIFVEPTDAGPKVTGARCNGVSRLIAERIPHLDLREARVPIVIRYVGTTITVDEAGRVRAGGLAFDASALDRERVLRLEGGWTPRADGDEIREARQVEALAKWVLSRTLAQNGVGVGTDDRH